MKNKVMVIGAAFVDVIMNIPKIPESGGDATGKMVSSKVGGCAFNVYGALASQDAESDLLVPVGKGQYAEVVRQEFRDKNIPVILDEQKDDNGWDLCLVEPNGERTFITVQGIEQDWETDWFKKIDLTNYKFFYISGYETEDAKSSQIIFDQLEQRRPDSYILFDASPRIRYIDSSVLNRILQANTIIHCNADEISYLSSATAFDDKLADIYHQTQSPVLVTMGAQGTCVFDNQGKRMIDGEKVHVVNTIGAGDTHCGGVLAGLQQGLSIDNAVKLGNHLSASVVQQEAGSL